MDTAGLVPVFVLRGGLALKDAYAETVGCGPMGVVAPWRAEHTEAPVIGYASLPIVPGARYALVDTLIASGRTMTACLNTVHARLPGVQLDVVAPFVATVGRERIIAGSDSTHVHCIWHAEDVDAHGRMVGPGFDVGDLAFGWSGRHLLWSGPGEAHA
jgi:uracil phosphoribosyltransferase